MSTRDRGILLAFAVLALVAAFWFLLLSPKREEAGQLQDEISALRSAVSEQEQLAQAAAEARKDFPRNYQRVVVLGKAVPEDADTSSLLVQLSRLAHESGVEFRAIRLSEAEESSAETDSTPTPVEPSVQEPPAETSSEAPVPVAEPTEAAAASLPLGAAVGPADLPVMPYELQFRGDFFAIADFIAQVNKMVDLDRDGIPVAFGRLITIDGFALSVPDETDSASASSTTLEANFEVRTYLTPEEQGITAGATPSGPAAPAEAPVSTGSESAPPTASAGSSVTGATP